MEAAAQWVDENGSVAIQKQKYHGTTLGFTYRLVVRAPSRDLAHLRALETALKVKATLTTTQTPNGPYYLLTWTGSRAARVLEAVRPELRQLAKEATLGLRFWVETACEKKGPVPDETWTKRTGFYEQLKALKVKLREEREAEKAQPPQAPKPPTKLAEAGRMIDSASAIIIVRQRATYAQRGYIYRVSLTVARTDKTLLQALCAAVGDEGHIGETQARGIPSYVLSWHGARAVAILTAIRPWLNIRAEEAALAKRFWREGGYAERSSLTEALLDKRDELFEEMRALKLSLKHRARQISPHRDLQTSQGGED